MKPFLPHRAAALALALLAAPPPSATNALTPPKRSAPFGFFSSAPLHSNAGYGRATPAKPPTIAIVKTRVTTDPPWAQKNCADALATIEKVCPRLAPAPQP